MSGRITVCAAGATGWAGSELARAVVQSHDSGGSARPYVDGALIAIRRVSMLRGVHRGLDAVLDL